MARYGYHAEMPPNRLTRAEQVAANDVALRTAAGDVMVEEGWEATTFGKIARRAGLTVGALYARAESVEDVAVDLWEQEVGPWFDDAVNRLITSARAGDSHGLLAALGNWDKSARMSALVVELLVASDFDQHLREVITASAHATLAPHITPSSTSDAASAHAAAAGTLVVSFGLGRAIAARCGVNLPEMGLHEVKVHAGMFAAQPSIEAPPTPPALRWLRELDDLDPTQQSVVLGTLEVIGRVGYRNATVTRIARAAGVPRGGLLSNFSSKTDLLAHAARTALIPPREVWEQYQPVVEEHGPLTARAIFLAEFLKPENRPMWSVNLELARISRVIPELAEFVPAADVLSVTHLGVMLTALIAPDLDGLPYAGPFTAGTAT